MSVRLSFLLSLGSLGPGLSLVWHSWLPVEPAGLLLWQTMATAPWLLGGWWDSLCSWPPWAVVLLRGFLICGTRISSMPATWGQGYGSHPQVDTYMEKPEEYKHAHTHRQVCTQVYTQVVTDTHYFGLLLPLNISCSISTVCSSATFNMYYLPLLMLMLMLVVPVASLLCCFLFSAGDQIFHFFSHYLLFLLFFPSHHVYSFPTSLSFFLFCHPIVRCDCNNFKKI